MVRKLKGIYKEIRLLQQKIAKNQASAVCVSDLEEKIRFLELQRERLREEIRNTEFLEIFDGVFR